MILLLTAISSFADTFVPNSVTTTPLTFTFPSLIYSSAFLLEVTPDCGITFCKRSI